MAKDFYTNINLHKNSLLDSKIDPQISLPTTNLFEGRIITHKGKVYIYYNGAWVSVSDLAILAEKANLATLAEKANLATLAEKAELAEDLVGRPEVYNEEFTFQPTANTDSVRDGIATIKSIKGNTVVANQLVNGRETLTLISGRKYYLNIQGAAYIITATSGQVLEVNAGDVVIDLAKFFNTDNEPTSLEEFERLYPNLPTDYNKGSFLNFNAEEIKSVGFNAFNGEYAKVLGDMQYYLGGNITSLVFKENLEDEGEVIEIPSDNLYTPNTNGYLVATGNDICINLSHSGYRNGEYEPYKESIVNLPIKKYFPDGMKSAGEVRDEIVWDSEKYKAIQRIGSVDMGTLGWIKSSKSGIFGVDFREGSDEILKASYDIICQEYLVVTTQNSLLNTNKSIINSWLYYRGLNVYDDEAWNSMTAAEFKASLSGKYLYYKLATPIETIIEEYNFIDYEVSDFGTEEILSDVPTTPIIAEIQYGFNAVDVIRNNLFNIKKIFDLLLTKLSLTGGTMSGAIDMSTNPFINAGFEYVENLPTNNNFIGRQVFYNNKPYYYTGKEWITFPENSGGGGATGNFWNLLEANPEVTASSYLPTDDSVGVFEYLFSREELKKSRDIVVDFSRYQGGRTFRDFFSAYIDDVYTVYPYEWAYEQNTDLRFTRFKVLLTNNPYTYPIAILLPDNPIIKTNFSEVMTGLEYPNEEQARFFYLYPNSSVMVDFELQQHENRDYPILVNITAVSSFGTATYDSQRCSTEENQNTINNYLTANNIPYSTNKTTGEILYNAQDLLASICSKLK
jgi:hypothetical protein